MFEKFPVIFLLPVTGLIPLWLENTQNLHSFKFAECALWLRVCSIFIRLMGT